MAQFVDGTKPHRYTKLFEDGREENVVQDSVLIRGKQLIKLYDINVQGKLFEQF